MDKSILERFSGHGTLIQPNALEHILQKDDPDAYASEYLKNASQLPLVLTLTELQSYEQQLFKEQRPSGEEIRKPITTQITTQSSVSRLYGQNVLSRTDKDQENGSNGHPHQTGTLEKTPKEDPLSFDTVHTWHPIARDYNADIKILKDITGKSTCEGKIRDFSKLFSDRYDTLKKMLRKRRELANAIPINRIHSDIREVELIGIVNELRKTKNDHIRIELEDDSGTTTIMALKTDQEVYPLARRLMNDEVVGIKGMQSTNGDLIIAKNIVFPDVTLHHDCATTPDPLCAAFASDIHIGSNTFMTPQWNSFIKWINGELGNSRQREYASKIKYLIFPGDVVDGIGIYPGQEDDLTISDVYRQYEALEHELSRIPDHIAMVMQPGNHDAVRPAEPQPTFAKEIRDIFSGREYIFIGNPSTFTIHDIEVLSYHGVSLLDYATGIQKLNYNNPTPIMKEMLVKRHLAPAYGGYTPLAPEHSDYMVIDRSPDIFVTGHVHITDISNYRGVTMINASSWQDQTEYQKMMNFVPDPAKLPIVNLNTGIPALMDFSRPI